MNIARHVRVFSVSVLCLMAGAVASDDSFFPPEAETKDVNEGSLVFLARPPQDKVHTHRNRIILSTASLQHGWASLYQCHESLDSVPAAQIVYDDTRIRQLQVASVTGIGRAWVEGHTIQLEDVSETAGLCIEAESRVVHRLGGDRFMVRNGPFMRRFLDGYYPMHVSLNIQLPPGDWQLETSQPRVQPGFNVISRPDGLSADAWFEGKLVTEFYFIPANSQ